MVMVMVMVVVPRNAGEYSIHLCTEQSRGLPAPLHKKNRQPGCGAFGSGTLNFGSDGGAKGLVVGGGVEGRVHDGTRDVLLLSVDGEGFSLGGEQAVIAAAIASAAANRTVRGAILRTLVDLEPVMGRIFACAAGQPRAR